MARKVVAPTPTPVPTPIPTPVPAPSPVKLLTIDFFGQHINTNWNNQAPSFPVKHVRIWDDSASWPVAGSSDEANLAKALTFYEAHGIKSMLTIARRNQAPPSTTEYQALVTHVAQKFGSRLEAVELWNEPDTSPTSLPVNDLLRIAPICRNAFKAANPAIQIVGPGVEGIGNLQPGRYTDQFLAGGGGKFIDVLSHHFYDGQNDPAGAPQRLVDHVGLLRILAKNHGFTGPLWNTEFNWITKGVILSDADAALFVKRTLTAGAKAGLDRFYWYAYAGTRTKRADGTYDYYGVLMHTNGVENAAALAYGKAMIDLAGKDPSTLSF